MSIKHYKHVWKNYPGKKGGHKLVFLALAEFANDETDQCWPSIAAIADMVGLSERQVQRILRDLESDRYIAITTQPGRRNSNIYQILPMTPNKNDDICDIKGDIYDAKDDAHDTVLDQKKVTSETKKVTSSAEKVTSGALKGDIHVTRTVIEPIQEPEKEPEGKSTLPPVDGLAALMAKSSERFEYRRKVGGIFVSGWQVELNKQVEPKLRIQLAESLAQVCGLTAAMEDDTILRDLHEYAVKFYKAGYQTVGALQDLQARWLADEWRKSKHPMPSLIAFFKFGSQQLAAVNTSPPSGKSGRKIQINNLYTGQIEERVTM